MVDILSDFAECLKENAIILSILGALAAFLWPIFQFVLVRRRDQFNREFDVYHRLIKELVQPDPDTGFAWLDRQVAVVFELRNFPRYYPVTGRILGGLREKFSSDMQFKWPRLIEEMDLTLEFLRRKQIPWFRLDIRFRPMKK